jgi:hypothetical protein
MNLVNLLTVDFLGLISCQNVLTGNHGVLFDLAIARL